MTDSIYNIPDLRQKNKRTNRGREFSLIKETRCYKNQAGNTSIS